MAVFETDWQHVVYCGTEEAKVVVAELQEDGTAVVKQTLSNSTNPHRQRCGPGGIAVEWVTLNPLKRMLYALTCYWDKQCGEAVSYFVDSETGLLTKSDGAVANTGGHQPCQAELSPDSGWLAVAHYLDGVVSILDARSGELAAELVCRRELPGERLGMGKHKGPLAHGVQFTPDGAFVAVADAGQARICMYSFDKTTGQLGSSPSSFVSSVATDAFNGCLQMRLLRTLGPRPRHVAFHPKLPVVYVVTECGNAVAWHSFDSHTGSLEPSSRQVRSQAGIQGEVACCLSGMGPGVTAPAEITVTPDGLYLYVSNRGIGKGENSIAAFSLHQDTGAPARLKGIAAGAGPRHFVLFESCQDSNGTGTHQFLLAGLQNGKSLSMYRRNPSDGSLTHLATSKVGYSVDCVQVLSFPPKNDARL